MGQDRSFREILEAKYLSQLKKEAYEQAYQDLMDQLLGGPQPAAATHGLMTDLYTQLNPTRFLAPGHQSYARYRPTTGSTATVAEQKGSEATPAQEEKRQAHEPVLEFTAAQQAGLDRLRRMGISIPGQMTARQLKKIYRNSLRATHPDSFVGQPDGKAKKASLRFQQLKEAWSLVYRSSV